MQEAQRTVVTRKPFDSVIGATQTSSVIQWGVSHIRNTRVGSATGNAGLIEVLLQSGEGAPWDTKHFLPPASVFIVNGRAEQRDYVGNAIWGAGLNSLGVSELTARGGSQLQSLRSAGRFDDPRDQEAIGFGYSINFSNAQGSSPASGGFIIYPNKPNTNTAQAVYSK